MINPSYVRYRTDDDEFHDFIVESVMNAEKIIDEFHTRCYNYEIMHLTESAEDAPFYTEGAVGLVEGVGQTIQNIIAKLLSFLKGIKDKFDEMMFGTKTDLQKIDEVCKKNPNFAQTIQEKYNAGELDVRDWKDIADAEEKIAKLLQDTADGKLDADQAISNVDKVLRFVESKATTIATIGGAAVTVFNAVQIFQNIRGKIAENKAKRQEAANMKKLNAVIQANQSAAKAKNAKNLSAFNKVAVYATGAYARLIQKEESKDQKAIGGITGFIKRLGSIITNKDNATMNAGAEAMKKSAKEKEDQYIADRKFVNKERERIQKKTGDYKPPRENQTRNTKNNQNSDNQNGNGKEKGGKGGKGGKA